MPDYSKGSVSIFETKPFQDWVKAKGYRWPPMRFDERDALYSEFMRDGFGVPLPAENQSMSDKRFLQYGFDKRLSHLIEECGELLAAAGKTQRWGVWSFNPLIPKCDRETNLVWLRREMADVRQALDRLDDAIEKEFQGRTGPRNETLEELEEDGRR